MVPSYDSSQHNQHNQHVHRRYRRKARGWCATRRHSNRRLTHPFSFTRPNPPPAPSITCIATMVLSSVAVICAAITGATALQLPLASNHQAPIKSGHATKPLVSSAALQDLISGDRLLERAKRLYEIAKLGEKEYNHPTRVIGSAGKYARACYGWAELIISQATLGRCPTFMRLFSSWATTTPSQTSRFLLYLVPCSSRASSLAIRFPNLPPLWP